MILPSKHIKFSQSILGLSGFLLDQLNDPKTIDELWSKYTKSSVKRFPSFHDFDNVILAVNLLFIIGAIDLSDDGKIMRL